MMANRFRLVPFLALVTIFGFFNSAQCMWNAAQHIAEGIRNDIDNNYRERVRINGELLAARARFNALPADSQDPVIIDARTDLARNIAHLEMQEGFHNGVANAAKGIYDIGLEAARRRANLEAFKQEERAKGEGEAIARTAQMKAFFESAIQPKNLAFLAGATLSVAGVYYATKLAYEYALANLGKPTLVRETSRGSLIGSIRKDIASLFGYEDVPTAKLSDIVLSPDIQEKVMILADDTKETRQAGLPYQNALFYGPPGTGKTEFAKTLAYTSGMDYAILSGADFSQFKGGEAVAELHKLIDWSETCENGLILFFDEADAAFRDRATQDKDGVNLVNAFLSRTGGSSNKFMIILATNYEDELDAAVRSRIHKKLPFYLPGLDERFIILKKKMDKYLFNDQRTYEKDGQEVTVHLSVADDVSDDYIQVLAESIDGFSGRDIDYMISEVRLRAYRSGNNLVTREIVDKVAENKKAEIEKDKATTAYQKERQKASRAKMAVVAQDVVEVAAAA